MFKKTIDIYEYSKEYRNLLKSYKIIYEDYQKSRINIHEQPTKDSDPEFDALREIELKMKNFRLKEISDSFNFKSIGLLIVKKINTLKKEHLILNHHLIENNLTFEFQINDKKVNLEYKYQKIQLRQGNTLLYVFDNNSLNEYFTDNIKLIIPQINLFDFFNFNRFMKKIIKYLIPHLNIIKENLISPIEMKAYDILNYEVSIREAIKNKLPIFFDFSYFVDNRPTNYNQISDKERNELKEKWIELFNGLDWSVHQFIQLNNLNVYKTNIDDYLFHYQNEMANYYHYNMFFLMILLRSYDQERTHIVSNVFAKFLLSFYKKTNLINVDEDKYKLTAEDNFELHDEFFWIFEGIKFFPNNKIVKFFTEANLEDLETHYKEFKKDFKIREFVARKRIESILL